MRTRRDVLKGLGGVAMAPLLLSSLAAEAAGSDTILVAIMLAGGNDGLNTVIPLGQYGDYVKLRTPGPAPAGLALAYPQAKLAATAFDPNPATAAASATHYAFNPAMTAMRALYATGKLAVIAGVSLPLAELDSLSHFSAEQDWQTGEINSVASSPPGWLGLTLEGAPAGALGPVVSFGGSAALLNTATSQGLALPAPLETYGIDYGATDNYYAEIAAAQMIMAMPATGAAAYDRAVVRSAHAALSQVHAIAHQEPVKDYPAPRSWLDQQLREIARLILAGSGVRGYYAVQGDYDTHSAQQQTQPALLAQLGTALTSFHGYLAQHGAAQNVVIMTLSDFGRRPQANEDFGTDHGAASVGFVLGDRVKGGVYGRYPSLTKLDVNGNLALAVDFRNLLSDVIGAMGGNPKAVLGQSWPRLGFI